MSASSWLVGYLDLEFLHVALQLANLLLSIQLGDQDICQKTASPRAPSASA